MGVDWLDPTQRALIFGRNGSPTENHPTEEVQGKHDANAYPVAENRSGEVANCQPVPQEQENPALQTVDAEHKAQAEQTAQQEHQATATLINRNQLVFHSIDLFLLFCIDIITHIVKVVKTFSIYFFLMGVYIRADP